MMMQFIYVCTSSARIDHSPPVKPKTPLPSCIISDTCGVLRQTRHGIRYVYVSMQVSNLDGGCCLKSRVQK